MKSSQGFTLIELMIVIAIIGILASVAVPQYALYVKKSKFTEIITHTHLSKAAVMVCFHERGGLDTCNGAGGSDDYPGIPKDITTPIGLLSELKTEAGVITAKANAELDDHTYILSPNTIDGNFSWIPSGTCSSKGFC